MELLEFKHENDPARNRELFGLLGEYATNSVIWEKLGGTISSEPGRLWFIATDGETRHGVAFGSMRFGRTPVLEHCLECARKSGTAHLTTTDYWTRKELYLRYGFAPARKIGRFVRFEKDLTCER